MRKISVRRAAPWCVAAAAIAVVPVQQAVLPTVATAAAGQSASTGSVAASYHLASLAALGSSSAAAAQSQGADARQLPHRSGSSFAASRAAAIHGATALTVPVVAPTSVSGTSGAVQSFTGLTAYQERYGAANGNQFTFTPPDQGMCVGNGYVMESVNDAIRVYSETSGAPLTPPIATNAFYGFPYVINRTTGRYGPEPTDPTCYFDPQYQRWFHVSLILGVTPTTGALTLKNFLDIAVSSTSSPLGGWVDYKIAAQDDGSGGTPKHTSCPCIGDYPHIGADRYGFYVTTNEYPWGSGPGVFGNNFNGAQIYAISKFALAQQDSSVRVVHLSNLALSNGTPSFTLWPSEVPGTAYDTRRGGSEWFSQSTAAIQETKNAAGMSNYIAVWRLSNTKSLDSSSPSLAIDSRNLNSETYGVPPPSEQKVGPVPLRDCLVSNCLPGLGPSKSEVEGYLDSNDTRMQSAWLANGHLYTALDTVADVNGRYQAAIAYFIVDLSGATLHGDSISNQGYVAVAGNVTYPSIATLADGTGAMAMTLVGASYFPSAAYMTISPAGPVGSVTIAGHGKGPDDEFCQYVFFDCGNTSPSTIRPRWGDYGMAQVDGTQVWLASEFIDQTCTITQYQADPTCGGTRAPLSNWATRISQITP